MIKVLIVEDNVLFAKFLRVAVQTAGYQVTKVCHNAMDAMGLEETPDIALLDLVLQDETGGATLAGSLRNRYPGLPIVFITGASRPAQLNAWLMQPHATFLYKPVTVDEILAAMFKVVQSVAG